MGKENIRITKEITDDNLEKVTITIHKMLDTKELALLEEHGLEEIDEVDIDFETGLMTLTVAYEGLYRGEW